MHRPVKLARLAQLDPLDSPTSCQPLTTHSTGATVQKRGAVRGHTEAPARKGRAELSSKVDRWAADMEQMKELLMSLHPAAVVLFPVGVPSQESPLPLHDALSVSALSSQSQGSLDDEASRTAAGSSH